jgi:hypothetical protein
MDLGASGPLELEPAPSKLGFLTSPVLNYRFWRLGPPTQFTHCQRSLRYLAESPTQYVADHRKAVLTTRKSCMSPMGIVLHHTALPEMIDHSDLTSER